MKRILLAIFCLTLLLGGCGSRPSAPLRVALILRPGDEEYRRSLEEGARIAALELDAELTVFSQPEDQAGQLAACLEESFDAIVVMPEDCAALAPHAGQARRKGIPFVTVDAETELEGSVSLVTSNNRQACNMLADRIAEWTGGTGRAAILGHSGADEVTAPRGALLGEYFKTQTEITLAAPITAPSEAAMQEAVERLLAEDPAVDILVGLDTVSVLGAAAAIEETGRDIRLFGFDCSHAQAELLEKDVLLATAVQSPYSMGYLSVQSACEARRGGEVKERFYTPVVIITKNNMFVGINQKTVFPLE